MMYEHTGNNSLKYRRVQMPDRQDLDATPPEVIDPIKPDRSDKTFSKNCYARSGSISACL